MSCTFFIKSRNKCECTCILCRNFKRPMAVQDKKNEQHYIDNYNVSNLKQLYVIYRLYDVNFMTSLITSFLHST